jgi:hypothetical protein
VGESTGFIERGGFQFLERDERVRVHWAESKTPTNMLHAKNLDLIEER